MNNTEDRKRVLKEAAIIFLNENICSTSLLQRKMRLGYNNAASIIEELCSLGIVGESNGSKPRNILVNSEKDIDFKININHQ